MNACTCDVGLGNTGAPNCVPAMRVAKKLIVVNRFDADGNYNEIDLTDTLNEAYFLALTNNADASKKWFPFMLMKNVKSERAETKFQEFVDCSKEVVQQGIRPFEALLTKQGPIFLSQIEGYACNENAFYLVDGDDNLIGDGVSHPGFLRPIAIANNTWDPIFQMPTDTTVSAIKLGFEWENTMKDSSLRMIQASDLGTSMLSLRGLLDIEATVVTCTQTVLTIDLYNRYGSLLTPLPIRGLVTADFGQAGNTSKIYNVTDAAWVTVVAAEVTGHPGRYTLTYTSQTVADVLMPAVLKTNFDDTQLRLKTATVA
jgi:hypothetical protein